MIKLLKTFKFILLINLLFLYKINAHAQITKAENKNDKFKIKSKIINEINYIDNYKTTKASSNFHEANFKVRQYSNFYFNKKFFVKTYIKGQKEDNPNTPNSKNRYFDNFALYLREININYQLNDNLLFKAGKMNLYFGKAWKWQRGIMSHKLAKNYQQSEKIGFLTKYSYGNEQLNGKYNFNFAIFQDDDKYLDNSIITNRVNDKIKSQSGLKSYLFTVNINFDFGEKYNSKEYLQYHFGMVNKSLTNKNNIDKIKLSHQKSYAAGFNYHIPIYYNFNIDTLYEFVKIDNLDGNKHISEKYHSINNIINLYNNFQLTFAKTWLNTNNKILSNSSNKLTEISAGYNFNNSKFYDNLIIKAGYNLFEEKYLTKLYRKNSYLFLIRYMKNY